MTANLRTPSRGVNIGSFAATPTDAARLRLDEAQYRAGDDSAAPATLHPLLAGSSDLAARAALFDAASETLGDLAAARAGYERWRAAPRAGTTLALASLAAAPLFAQQPPKRRTLGSDDHDRPAPAIRATA